METEGNKNNLSILTLDKFAIGELPLPLNSITQMEARQIIPTVECVSLQTKRFLTESFFKPVSKIQIPHAHGRKE
jgi:hypothetical protein